MDEDKPKVILLHTEVEVELERVRAALHESGYAKVVVVRDTEEFKQLQQEDPESTVSVAIIDGEMGHIRSTLDELGILVKLQPMKVPMITGRQMVEEPHFPRSIREERNHPTSPKQSQRHGKRW